MSQPRAIERFLPILICECGEKFIKTEEDQIICLLCIKDYKKYPSDFRWAKEYED